MNDVVEKAGPSRPASFIVRPRDWMHELGVKKHGLSILIRDHGHPKPIALGSRSAGFIRSELDAWIEARKAARDAA